MSRALEFSCSLKVDISVFALETAVTSSSLRWLGRRNARGLRLFLSDLCVLLLHASRALLWRSSGAWLPSLILQWTWPSADSLFSFPKGGAQVQVRGFPLACKSQPAFRLGYLSESVSASLPASTQLGELCSRTHSHASHIPPPPPREITGGEDLSTVSCAALGARISCFFLQRKHPNFFFQFNGNLDFHKGFLCVGDCVKKVFF